MARTKQTARMSAAQIIPRQSRKQAIAKKIGGVTKPAGVKKPHRFKPGTVALR